MTKREEMRKFEKEMEAVLEENEMQKIERVEMSKDNLKNKFFLKFCEIHEKKLIRNIEGIEKVSNQNIKDSLLRKIDQNHPYRKKNKELFSKIRASVVSKPQKSSLSFSGSTAGVSHLPNNNSRNLSRRNRINNYGKWYLAPKEFVHTLEIYQRH